MPAKAGIHNALKILDSRLRGNDDSSLMQSFPKSPVADATSPCRAIALFAARLRVTNDLEME